MVLPAQLTPPQLLTAYLAARYLLFLPDGEHELTIGRIFDPDGLDFAPGTPWALITAFNPASRPQADTVNRQSQRVLRHQLSGLTTALFDAVSSDRDGGHTEPGVLAIGVDVEHTDALALQFGQAAMVAGSLGAPARLRCFVAAWHADIQTTSAPGVDTRLIDWVASGHRTTLEQ